MTKELVIAGINIQSPWAELLLEGKKTIETRAYALPPKYWGKDLALIRTPGSSKELRSEIIGIIRFESCFKYSSKDEWTSDLKKHLVPIDHPQFKFLISKPKFGWKVTQVKRLRRAIIPPKPRGIVFASNCKIPTDLLYD